MSWLETYYGKDFDKFQPTVVFEGKRWAVVRLSRNAPQKGYSSVGYVLIQKRGTHASSVYVPLHEGVATQTQLDEMAKVLAKKEAE